MLDLALDILGQDREAEHLGATECFCLPLQVGDVAYCFDVKVSAS